MNYGSSAVGFLFATADQGVATGQDGEARGFSYTYRKTQPDVALLVLEYSDGTVEEISQTFWDARVGVFQSSVARGEGRRPRRTSGSFRAGDSVEPEGAVPPQRLEGSSFIFRDRGMATQLTFTTEFSGTLSRRGGSAEDFRYSYDLSASPSASLLIALSSSGESHEYVMRFGARDSGVFVRRVIRGGKLWDTDRGQFSGRGADDDGHDHDHGLGDTERRCPAPKSLEGTTLKVRIGGTVTTIVLNGRGNGVILQRRPNGRVSLQPFTYKYSKESCDEGQLTITLPGGDSDEVRVFELDFTARGRGDCVRKTYEDNELDDTDPGTFTLEDNDSERPRDNQPEDADD